MPRRHLVTTERLQDLGTWSLLVSMNASCSAAYRDLL